MSHQQYSFLDYQQSENYLKILEAEAVFVLREAAAQFQKPSLLFSGGKDSTVLVHLALKAFYPSLPPFPVLHIDTGHNFPEALSFRDQLVEKTGLNLFVRKVGDTLSTKNLVEPIGKFPSRNAIQAITLLDAINDFGFDCCVGGGRRDEEKARAKERFFSIRDKNGVWQPHNQRPELWNIYNGKVHKGENVRVFPISNWTEIDIWQYIRREQINIPSLYFTHQRKCVVFNNRLLAWSEFANLDESDQIITKKVRFRTVGDMTCTAAIESNASTIDEVIVEIENSQISERGATRIDDLISDAGMEDRKLRGYF